MENNYINPTYAFFSAEEKAFYDRITREASALDKEKLFELFAETLSEVAYHNHQMLKEINSQDGLTPLEYASIIKNHIQNVYDSYARVLAQKNQIEEPVSEFSLPGNILK